MIKHIEQALDTLGAISVILLCLVIAAIVLWREFLGMGFPDGIVIVRELMVPAILFPLAATTSRRGHVSIEVLANHFPDVLNRWIAVLAAFLGLFVMLTLVYAGWTQFSKAWVGGTHLGGDFNIPKWPSRLLYVIAIAFAAVRMAHILWVDLKAAWTGHPAPEVL